MTLDEIEEMAFEVSNMDETDGAQVALPSHTFLELLRLAREGLLSRADATRGDD